MNQTISEIITHLLRLHQNHVFVRREQLAASKNMKAAAIATDQVIQKIEEELHELGAVVPTANNNHARRPATKK
ncbi:MAG: hypothetical protein GXP26_13255 [Planctomycetes bacterium]|nr:hypothetical protein [Planctomycetota bacterium]